ncbi:MAG TPA: GTP cyclohydrolase II [Rhizomicrobium sp.]|nr:GTP cyclohydrolase II [Rhizomicrobium sp.]
MARVARAVESLRRGQPVVIKGKESLVAIAVETASDKTLAKAPKDAVLALTQARARTLKIRLYTPEVAALPLAKGATMAELRAIADPTTDLRYPMKGPFDAVRGALPAGTAAAVKLAKLAGLLPAVVVWPIAGKAAAKGAAEVDAQETETYDDEVVRTLTIVTRARVPLEGAENAELVAFRGEAAGPEHYAVVIGAPPTHKPVLARLHSECFTGDLLGSLKCDCGSQLRGAVAAIAKAGGGVLLYLAQEGRGIGLINKLRAYRLQDQGFDTIEANERLGFEADERRFGIAAKMLKLMGYGSVKLMTNNPDKVAALEAHGIKVVKRVRHAFPSNAHNRAYLKTKSEKAGHLF